LSHAQQVTVTPGNGEESGALMIFFGAIGFFIPFFRMFHGF
jgi:hypothetical protein